MEGGVVNGEKAKRTCRARACPRRGTSNTRKGDEDLMMAGQKMQPGRRGHAPALQDKTYSYVSSASAAVSRLPVGVEPKRLP